MSASLFLENNNFCGQIKIEKNEDGVTVRESSNFSKLISGRDQKIPLDSLYNIIAVIKSVVGEMCFTSRFIDTDMFTKETYSEDNECLISKYIYMEFKVYMKYLEGWLCIIKIMNTCLFVLLFS